MNWGTLRDQVRTPSSRPMGPSRPEAKKQRRDEDEGEGAEAELQEGRGG